MMIFISLCPHLSAGSIVRCIPHSSAEIILAIKALGTGIIHLNLLVRTYAAHDAVAVLHATELVRYFGIIQSLDFIHLPVFKINIKHRGLERFSLLDHLSVFRVFLCTRIWINAIPIRWVLSFYFKHGTMDKDERLFEM